MAKQKRCADLWVDIEFDLGDLSKPDNGPTKVHQSIGDEDPEEGYHVRGTGPVTRDVNPECDAY